MRPEVSICIAATRPAGLVRLLASLSRQKLPPGLGFEVIVVDNAPCEASRAAAQTWNGAAPLRRLEEPVRNVALARNRAVDAAAGRWLAFVDDDETAEENWLEAFEERASRGEADGFFGPVLPHLEEVVTPWLDLETFYARPRFATGTILGRGDLRTGNAWLRAQLFQGRRFDPAWGRSGGEDSELFGRMLRAGARLEWCDEARVVEWIAPERHTPRWLARRAFRGGVTFSRMERKRGAPGGLGRPLAAALALGATLPFAALRGRRAALQTWLRLCTQAGHLHARRGGDFEAWPPRGAADRRDRP